MENKSLSFLEEYDKIVDLGGDPRTMGWMLMDSFKVPVCVICAYILVSVLGPMYMRDRKAVQLGHWLTVYNVGLVFLSLYMAIEIMMTAIKIGYTLGCQPVDYTNDPLSIRMARGLWTFYISKYVEILDTIIFIVRKKNNQITFLHVFHHATMIFNGYICTRYVPGGAAFLHAAINSGVHVVMYTYYGLSAIAAARPYLWWKKYITKMQLIQFVIILIHTLNGCFRCDFPVIFVYLAMFYTILMMILFGNFYYQEYFRRAKLRAMAQKKKNDDLEEAQASNADTIGQNGSRSSNGHQKVLQRSLTA